MKILGISRGNQYSPNHIGNDAAIFNCVVENLRTFGYEVITYTEQEFTLLGRVNSDDVIIDMARDSKTLTRLHELERNGVLVINSPQGIENCVRRPMTEMLIRNEIPHPDSYILQTDVECEVEKLSFPCWIKRGESHALVKDDVCYATTSVEAQIVLDDFKNRNIPDAVVNKHLQGDLVKFYGVQDTSFFYWFYPSPCSHSKFGLEKINGVAKGFHFEPEELKMYANRASAVLNVPIYGGDAVVLSDGTIKLIDFNDWPSFAPCRESAGFAIAQYIVERIKRVGK